jgi:hypothetical protein
MTADELNAYLDSLVQGGAPRSANVDPAVVESASHFHRLGALAKPEHRFVVGLEEKLMKSSMSVATQQLTTAPISPPNANGNVRMARDVAVGAVRSHRLKPILLAAVTAICIASAIALGAYRLMPPGRSESDEIPAPAVAMQSSPESAATNGSECTVTPRTAAQDALRGTPTVDAILEATTMVISPAQESVGVPAMPVQDLPTGEPASNEVKDRVGTTILELVACRNAGDWERMDALFSDDSFRRAYGLVGRPVFATPASSPPPPAPITVPAVLEMRVLPDGRVGALLSHDLGGYGLWEYLIFVEVDGRWLLDEEVIVKQDDASDGIGIAYYVVLAYDNYFEPNRLVVPAKEEVFLQVENLGAVPHRFVVDALDIAFHLYPVEVTLISISAPAGEHGFFSDIPGQRAAGMEGVLVVMPYATPVADQFGVDCDTAIVSWASPEVEAGPGTPVVIYAPVTSENSRLVDWEGTCDD